MHYSQYLYLTNYVVKNRINESIRSHQDNKIYKNYFFIIVVYAIIMTLFSLLGKSTDMNLNNLIIVPIIGQMLHFYLDSQLWKFSIDHNKENVLKYILRLIS